MTEIQLSAMSETERVELAARLEHCALIWRADAMCYRGWRRQWRLGRARQLMTKAELLIGYA